jgi:putative heme-binding domain-containing protein
MDVERPFPVRVAAVRGLAKSRPGAERLLEAAEQGTLPEDVQLIAGGLLARDKDAKLRQRASQTLPLPEQKGKTPLAPIDQLATMKGDVAHGEKLFRGQATCANCHTVNGFGKQVGPDLSEIGKKLSREAMYVSILAPNAGISHNYENHVVLLDSGQVVSGVLLSETDDSVTLRTAEAIDRTFSRDEIELLKKSDQSLMPADLQTTIDQQGLIDVVEYMTTLQQKHEG